MDVGLMMRLFWLIFLLVFGTALRAETLQHGNIIYTLPPDWSAGRADEGIQVLLYDPADEVCEYCYAYLGAGTEKSGSLIDYVTATAPLFLDEDDRASAEVMQAPTMSNLGSGPVALMGMRSGDDVLFVIGFELPSRFEIVAFEAYGGYDGDEIEASIERMQQTIVPMFDGLQFVSEGAKSLMPDPVPGPLNGVWWGTYMAQTFGLDMMLKFEIDHRYIVFWSDGYFYDGTPPNGTAALDATALRNAADANFGTYLAAGNTVTLTFASGETEVLTLTDDDIADSDRTLYEADLVPTGTRLNGSVSNFFYSGFSPGSGIEGGMSGGSDTTFLPDGTYTGSSFGGAFGNFVDGGGSTTGGFATNSDGDATGGRYEIIDGMLIQYPADGSPPSMAFVSRAGDGLLIGDEFMEAE
jgi:hypothetical protein